LTADTTMARVAISVVNNKDGHHHCCHRPEMLLPPPPSRHCHQRQQQRLHCHHHHNIDCHRRKTAIGSVPPLPPTTTTATLTLITLVLALPRTRIKRWVGGCAATHLIHCSRGCHCCWCHLCLRSQDVGAKEDGCSIRQDCHADHGQE
jgi:hypothetical protein